MQITVDGNEFVLTRLFFLFNHKKKELKVIVPLTYSRPDYLVMRTEYRHNVTTFFYLTQ